MPKKAPAKKKVLKKLPAKLKGYYRIAGLADYTDGLEPKFFDQHHDTASASNEWHLHEPLYLLPQNDKATGRDGNRILVKSLQMSGMLGVYQDDTGSVGTTDAPSTVSFYWRVFVDKQTNGALPTHAEYSATDNTARPAGLSTFLNNLEYAKRFVTVASGVIELPIYYKENYPDAPNHVAFNEYIRLDGQGLEVDIVGSTGITSEFKSNNLYLALQNNDPRPGALTLQEFSTRIRFVDK